MNPGQILVAYQGGDNIIRMQGDVRLTLCVSFDDFIQHMFNDESFRSVIFDLREAECIDSTTLGLMAKIALTARGRGFADPLVLTCNPNINRLLETMGFNDIFQLVAQASLPQNSVSELAFADADEEQVKARVLEAHKILMELNLANRLQFKALVDALESH